MFDNGRSMEVTRTHRRAVNRRVVWSIVALFVVVAALGAWIAVRALQAKAELEAAQGLFGQLQQQAMSFDAVGADATLQRITVRTDKAVELTSDPVWRAGEMVPFAGANLRAFRQIAALTSDVVDNVATPLIGAVDGLDPATLTPPSAEIDLSTLLTAAPAIAAAADGVAVALDDAEKIDTSGAIEQLSAARTRIVDVLRSVSPLLSTLDSMVPLMPSVLGADAPRTYVVMFQNPAESRALGGAALSFAVLSMDAGRIELQSTVSAASKNFRGYAEPVVAAPDGIPDLFAGTYATSIANSTVRPSFTAAAEITSEMWFRQFGYRVDGVVSIDPVALSYILGATDPITLSTGDVLTGDTLVPLLLNGVYQRYDSPDIEANNTAQDAVYAEAVTATFARLSSGVFDPRLMVDAIVKGWNEHRLLYWSADADEQARLVSFGLSGELPVSDATTERVGVYFQDNVGSKMNYYLQQTVHLARSTCRADGRENYRVTVDLRNGIDPAAASSLASSIVGTWKHEGVARGDQRMVVMLYAPPGSTIVSRSVNGAAVPMDALHDTTYPVSKIVVTIPAGAVSTVSFDVVAASPGNRSLDAVVTPMVNPTTVIDEVLDCATVG